MKSTGHLHDAFLQRAARLLSKGEVVLVGVSGGVDSMVLMHLLAVDWKVQVAHLNHKLRGKSSDADECLARKTAEKLGLPCHIQAVDVKALAHNQGVSIEMAARQCRHEFYARLARKLHIRKIALAHHADDQVELFLLRLLRGAGPEGLAGMAETAPSFVDPALTIVRPLLALTKNELREYAARHKIPFREDATNVSTSILRNRIRHKLIPLLTRDYQPGLAQNILRTMELLRAESEFIEEQASTSKQSFDDLPVSLQRRKLRKELYNAAIDADFDLVEHLRLNPGVPMTIGPNRVISRDPSGRLNVSAPTAAQFDTGTIRISAEGGSIEFGGLTLKWSIAGGKPAKNREYFDADRIGDSIILRHWQPGDRFQPIGMPTQVKLQDLFMNLKVPRPERHKRVVASTAAGEIFWVEGLRIAEKFKIEPFTRRRLKWSWRRHETC